VLAAWLVLICANANAQDNRGFEAASGLHKQAVKAYKAGRFKDAIDLWRGAEELDPQWKYVFNQVNALIELEQWDVAWRVWSRSEKLGVPVGKE